MKPTCETCPFWEDRDAVEEDRVLGECRVHSPELNVMVSNLAEFSWVTGWWPETRAHEWCGEHPDFPAYLASMRGPSVPKVTTREEVAP